MDIKITLDISDRFDSALARIVSAVQAVTVQRAPAPIASPAECDCLPEAYVELETLVRAKNSPVETPESSAWSKPIEPPKSEPDAKTDEPEPAPQPEPAAQPESEMTLDEIRSVCVKAAKVGKTKIITDYLAAHDAESLSKLDPKFYAELSKIVEAAL